MKFGMRKPSLKKSISARTKGRLTRQILTSSVFPDSLDEGVNVAIGYMPGHLKELAAGELQKKGVQILNDTITGQVHRDRILLTGDSPLASTA